MKNKKLFILLSALALSLSACNFGQPSTSNPSSNPGSTSSQEPASSVSSDPGSSSSPSSASSNNVIAVTGITLNKNTLSLEETKSENLTRTVVPGNASNTNVTWSSSDNSVATVSQLGRVTAVKVGTATITVTSVSNPSVSAQCVVTVTVEGGTYGSENKPLTIARALLLAAEEAPDSGDYSVEPVYVKGYVSNAPTDKGAYASGLYLKDSLNDSTSLFVYTVDHTPERIPYQNDLVTLQGYLNNYNGTHQISSKGTSKAEIKAVVRGTSTVTYSIKNATLDAGAPVTGLNGSKITFTPTPASGYKVDSVLVGAETIEPKTGGSYEAFVKGDTVVYVLTSDTESVIADDTMVYSGATTNMVDGNNAQTVGLDPLLFTVISDKPTGIYAGLNAAGNIRLYNGYNNAADRTLGTKITISSTRAVIKNIIVKLAGTTAATIDDLEVKGDDVVIANSHGLYATDASVVSLKNVTDATKSNQLHIDSVVIFYAMKQEVKATAITLDMSTLEVEAGLTGQLTATLEPLNSTDVPTWSSSNEAVATVDQTGKVTGVAEGTAVITASISETIKATATVTVTPAEIINFGTAEAPLTVNEARAVLDKEQNKPQSKQPLFVKGIVTSSTYSTQYQNYDIWLQNDDGSVTKSFELYATVLDESITTNYQAVDALKGLEVIATGYGKIFNTTYELTNYKPVGAPATIYPTVLSAKVPAATAISLDKTEVTLSVEGVSTLIATLTPANAVDTIIWETSDEAIATVDQTGVVTAVAVGTATITAKVNDLVQATCAVTVIAASVPATSVELNATSGGVYVGEFISLTATVLPVDSTDQVVWTSSDEAIATVDQTGKVTGVAAGNATITATAGTVKAEYLLTVTFEHGTVESDPLTVSEALAIGQALAHNEQTAKEYYISAYIYQVIDNSLAGSYNNASAWLADETGSGFQAYRVKPIEGFPTADYENFKVGAQILIKSKIMRYNAIIETVQNVGKLISINFADVPATGLTIDEEAEVEVGKNVSITSSFAPLWATTNKTIVWSSSDEAVATVDQTGKVTGVAAGNATITAQIGETIVDTCVVTVVAATVETEATYNLIQMNGKNTAYATMFDVTFADGKLWKIPGNQNLSYGLKIGGKPVVTEDPNNKDMERFFYSQTAYDSVSSIVITHGSKDTAITVNSLKLYVYDSAADAAAGSVENAAEVVDGTFVDQGITTFAPAVEGTKWEGKFFRVVYNMTTTAAKDNKGVVLTELKLVF